MKNFNFLMKLQLKTNFFGELNFLVKFDNFTENFNFLNHSLLINNTYFNVKLFIQVSDNFN